MRETIHVAGTKDETSTKLKGIRPEFVLMMAGFTSPLSRCGVVFAEKMEKVGRLQVGNAIGLTQFIYEQRERDARFLPENARVVTVAQTDGR